MIAIASMCISGTPELTLSSLNKADLRLNKYPDPVPNGATLKLRGDSVDPLRASFLAGKEREDRNDIPGAINAYTQAITPAAEPLNALAWLYTKQGELEVAESMSRVAVRLFPDSANYLDTLADIRFTRGDPAEASALMKRVVAIHSSDTTRSKLQRFEAALHKR